MSDATTKGVRVQVVSTYHPDRSDPVRKHWFFSYKVRITNVGQVPVTLHSRHWMITDGNGHVEHVRGPGVVGQQPLLSPGQSFTYESYCPLPTSMGSMAGTFSMTPAEGAGFDAIVAPFTLVDPDTLN